MQADVQPGVTTYTYSRNEGDFHAENIRIGNGEIFIDFVAPDTRINDIQLGVPVSINIENGVAAMALAHLSGATDEEIKQGMASFRGVDRRFDFRLKNDRIVFLSDYAHHPAEIAQSVKSVRELYQDKRITVIFQPHSYTRTRDFYRDFADSLSLSDEVILTEIYPCLLYTSYIGMILSVSRYTAKLEEQRMHDAQVPMLIDAGNAENPEQPADSEAQTAAEPTAKVLNSDAEFE